MKTAEIVLVLYGLLSVEAPLARGQSAPISSVSWAGKAKPATVFGEMAVSPILNGQITLFEKPAPLSRLLLPKRVTPATTASDVWFGGTGNWNVAANWSTGVPTSSSNVLIDNGNPISSVVNLNIAGLANTVTVDTGDTLNIENNESLTVSGSRINNAGAITMNSSPYRTNLIIGAPSVTLSGTGMLTMSNSANNVIYGAVAADTLINQQLIQGAGNIGYDQMTLVNAGTIDANQTNALTIQANGGTTNTGLLEATNGGTLGFANTTVTNTGATIDTTGGAISASSSTINGGTVNLTGGSLVNSTISGATVTVSGSGTLQLNGGVINNGTLANSGTIEAVEGSNGLGGTVTNSATGLIQLDSNTTTTLSGNVANAGAITMNSSPYRTNLIIGAPSVTLSGTGMLTMSNSANNLIYGAVAADTLINQQLIQGAGNIGYDQMTLVNAGTIDANQTNALTIQANGGTTNTGLLEATNGGTLGFANTTVTNTGATIDTTGGAISASSSIINGGTVNLTGGSLVNSTISGASVTVSGSGTLQLNGGVINNGTLANSGTIEAAEGSNGLGGTVTNSATGLIQLDSNTTTTLSGNVANAGAITMNSSPYRTNLIIGAPSVTLSGTGMLTMSNSANNVIYGAVAADTLINQQLIQGAGNIGYDQMTLVNAGTIDANQTNSLTIQANGGTTNTGLLEATNGGTLGFANTTVTNAGATIDTTGGAISASSSTINGGTVKLTGGSLVNSTISGASVTVSGSGTLQLNGGVINNGTLANSGTIEAAEGSNGLGGTVTNSATGLIQLDSNTTTTLSGNVANAGAITMNSSPYRTNLIIGAPSVTLSGTGMLTMSNSANNVIYGAVAADKLTNQQLIQGSGNIGYDQMTLVNAGTIDANQTNALTIQANGGTTNTGLLEATNGGTLGFANTTVTNTGATIDTTGGSISASSSIINGGTVNLTGGSLVNSTISGATVTVSGSGTLQLNGGVINNGTLANSGTIEAVEGSNGLGGTVTNTGLIQLDSNTTTTLSGNVANAGAITMNSSPYRTNLIIGAPSVTLSGTGMLTMSNSANNVIYGAVAADTLINQQLIEGSGNIGDAQMGFINDGTVLANQTTTLTIQPSSTGFTNNGILQVNAGSTLDITGGYFTNFNSTTNTLTGGTYNVDGGTLQFTNANIVTNAANITLSGPTAQIVSNTNANALANFATNAATGVFTLSGGSNFTTGGTGNFTNLGALVIGGTDTFKVSGNLNNFANSALTGGTYYVAGTLQFGASGSTLVTNAANLTLAGTGSLVDLGGNNLLSAFNTNASGGSFTVASAGSFTTPGAFTNAGTVDLEQASSLLVSGNLANSGTVSTNSQNLGGGANTLTVTGTLTNSAGANVMIGDNNDTTDTASAGLLANSGAVTVGSGATLTLTKAGSDSNSGTITLNGATLKLKATTALTGKGTVALSNGVLAGSGSGTTVTSTNTIEGSGTISNLGITNNGVLYADRGTPLNILPSAAGLKNNGAIEVAAGDVMRIGTSAGGALLNFAGTTLTGGTYYAGGTLEFGAVGSTIATNAANITLNGSGKMVNFGGNNLLAGFNNNLAAGVFSLENSASLTTTGGSFTNAGLFNVSTGTTFTVGGSSFNFTQTGGTATVNGILTSASLGTLAVNAGSLDGVGTLGYNVVDSGILAPGDSASATGKLIVADTYTQNSTGNLDIQINGATAGTNYDVLKVAQGATLGGTLNLTLGAGFTPALGETFTILTATSVSDTFAEVNGLAINGSEHFAISYTAHGVVLTVVSGALPPSNSTITQLLGRPDGIGGRHAAGLYLIRPQTQVIAPSIALAPTTTAAFHPRLGMHMLRPMDVMGLPVAPDPVSATSADLGNSIAGSSFGTEMASLMARNALNRTNHMRFECGVDLKALLQTRPKQLWKAVWAAPDSDDARSLGYMTYNETR